MCARFGVCVCACVYGRLCNGKGKHSPSLSTGERAYLRISSLTPSTHTHTNKHTRTYTHSEEWLVPQGAHLFENAAAARESPPGQVRVSHPRRCALRGYLDFVLCRFFFCLCACGFLCMVACAAWYSLLLFFFFFWPVNRPAHRRSTNPGL